MSRHIFTASVLPCAVLFLSACQKTGDSSPATRPLILSPTAAVGIPREATGTPTSVISTKTATPTQTLSASATKTATGTPTPTPTSVTQNTFAVGFSADGRFLAFNSSLDGLVPEVPTHTVNAFIYDTTEGTIELASVYDRSQEDPTRPLAARANSFSADGRFVLFGGVENNRVNFRYLRDRVLGVTERIDFLALDPALSSIHGTLSPDGRTLAVTFYATGQEHVREDTNNILLYERTTGKRVLVTLGRDGKPANGDSHYPVFSPDGRILAFFSNASNLVEGDTPCNGARMDCADVFLYEIAARRLERIPAAISLELGTPTIRLAVSSEARFLAWADFGESESGYRPVIRLFHRSTGQTETFCAGDNPCTGHTPALSGDGRWLAFATKPGVRDDGSWDPDVPAQVYLFDRQSGDLTLISKGADGAPGDGSSGWIQQIESFNSDVQISGNGRFVAFASQAASLLPLGAKKRQCFDPLIIGAYPCYDLFVYDREDAKLVWVSHPR
jgi:Tol biopolymer transport system component